VDSGIGAGWYDFYALVANYDIDGHVVCNCGTQDRLYFGQSDNWSTFTLWPTDVGDNGAYRVKASVSADFLSLGHLQVIATKSANPYMVFNTD